MMNLILYEYSMLKIIEFNLIKVYFKITTESNEITYQYS